MTLDPQPPSLAAAAPNPRLAHLAPLLARTCEGLVPAHDLSEACDGMLALLVEASGATRASLMTLNPLTGRLNVAAAIGLDPQYIGNDVPRRSRSISEWVMRNWRALRFDGQVRDRRFDGVEHGANIQSALSIPLTTASEIVGVLNLARTGPAARFTEADLSALQGCLRPVAEAIVRLQRAARAERCLQSLEGFLDSPRRTLVTVKPFHVGDYEFSYARRTGMTSGGEICERVSDDNGTCSIMVAETLGREAAGAATASFLQGVFVACANPERSAAGLMARLNVAYHARIGEDVDAAVWLAQVGRNGEISSCNAGYPAPFWVPVDGSEVHRLDADTGQVGPGEHRRYRQERFRLLPGDLLVSVGEGVLSARDGTDLPFGAERLIELLLEQRHRPLEMLTVAVCDALREHGGREQPTRDCTVFAMRYSPAR